MSDELSRELRKMRRSGITVRFDLDCDGYLDRQCPRSECLADFKVQAEEWENLVGDTARCPICGLEASKNQWFTPAQVDHINRTATAEFQRRFGRAMKRTARDFNQRSGPSKGLISVSMSVREARRTVSVPPAAAEAMQQRVACAACGCRYASTGTSFFCPACGHNSAVAVFDAAIASARKTLAQLPAIRSVMEEAQGSDASQDLVRTILEDRYAGLVAAYQPCAEILFRALPNAAATTVRKNVFQRLQESSDLWAAAAGRSYVDILGEARFAALRIHFQRRHLFAHNGGVVDEEYVKKTGDTHWAVGARVVVRERDVEEVAAALEDLVQRLRQCVAAAGGEVVVSVAHDDGEPSSPSESAGEAPGPPSIPGFTDAASRVAIFLGSSLDTEWGRPREFDGPALTEGIGLGPEEVNDAVDELKEAGMVELDHCAGTAPYHFGVVSATYFLWTTLSRYGHSDFDPEDDALRVAQAVVARRALSGEELAGETGLPVGRVNLAVEYLDDRRLVDRADSCGTAPFSFAGIEATSATRRFGENPWRERSATAPEVQQEKQHGRTP